MTKYEKNMRRILTDILNHLDGGGRLYPHSLIFEEDTPAVEVIRESLKL